MRGKRVFVDLDHGLNEREPWNVNVSVAVCAENLGDFFDPTEY